MRVETIEVPVEDHIARAREEEDQEAQGCEGDVDAQPLLVEPNRLLEHLSEVSFDLI